MLTITIDGVDQTYRVEIGDGVGSILTMADHGEVGTGQILLDDPDGDLSFNGWRPAYIEEDECVAQPRVWTGYVFLRTFARGRDSFRTDAARLVSCDINDLNARLGLKAWTTADAKRPQETETARMTALLASECLTGLVVDSGLVNTGSQVFDEADFRRQYAGQVLASMSSTSKDFFVYLDHASGDASLFWDVPEAAVAACTLDISNVLSDKDATGLYPYRDAELTRDPSEVYSRYWIEYAGGAVVMGTNATTAASYIDRDGGYTSTRIGRQSTAEAQLALQLQIHGVEQDKITVTVLVPAAQVGMIEAGQLINVRFTHLPGYETYTPQRIRSCDVRRFDASEEAYEVRLELSLAKRAPGPGGGGPGDFPHPPTPGGCGEGMYLEVIVTPQNPHWTSFDVGHIKGWRGWLTTENDPDATPLFPGDEYLFGGFSADSTAGDGTGVHGGFDTTWGPGNVGPLYSDTALRLYYWVWVTNPTNLLYHDGDCSEVVFTSGGAPPPGLNVTFVNTGAPAAAIPYETPVLVGMIDLTHDDAPPCGSVEPQPPLPGQWVYRDVPTPANGPAGTTFTTTWPFADGSLRVRLDEMDQTPGIVTYDGATGEFTLAFDVEVGEQLSVDYQGR